MFVSFFFDLTGLFWPAAWLILETTDFADDTDCMKPLKGDAKSARVSLPAAC
jgi:hypothetical protein